MTLLASLLLNRFNRFIVAGQPAANARVVVSKHTNREAFEKLKTVSSLFLSLPQGNGDTSPKKRTTYDLPFPGNVYNFFSEQLR